MEKGKAPTYDELIRSELENRNWSGSSLGDLSCQFSEKSVFELEVEQVKVRLREVLETNGHTRPIILLMFANRLVKIANKTIRPRSGGSLEEGEFLPELELLVHVLSKGNLVLDCCEYVSFSPRPQDFVNSASAEILNAVIKVPVLAINSVLALRPGLKSQMDCRILDKCIPAELHDSNYYGHIWLCVLHILNDPASLEKTRYSFLQTLFARLFLRGYRDTLCKLIVDRSLDLECQALWSKETLINGELCLTRIFDNVLAVNRTDRILVHSFVRQLLKEVERSVVRVREGVVFLRLRNGVFGENPGAKMSQEDDLFSLLKSAVSFCVLEQDSSVGGGLLRTELFLVKKQSFSVGLYLAFLDVCVLSIVKRQEFARLVSPEEGLDYLYRIRSEKHEIMDKSENNKAYLGFFKELILYLSKQWSSYQESMTYTLALSTVIVRTISIITYLNAESLPSLKETLLEFYTDITNGIHFRLKNIDPVIRSSAMFLGEFYFNLLYELFPSTEETDCGYSSVSEAPKFDELSLLAPEVRDLLACIYNASRLLVFEDPSGAGESRATRSVASIGDLNLTQSKEDPKKDQKEHFQDDDDEFWERAPSIKVKSEKERRTQPLVPTNKPSTPGTNISKQGTKRKLVVKSFDLITLYTDEKKSREILDREERLLRVLRELAEDIEKDDSNYDYLIHPLIDRLVSLKGKDQKVLALIILSKLIQHKADKVAVSMIAYSFNINNGVPMDIRILVLNSLTSACQNLANSECDSRPGTCPRKKAIVNLFDKHSLAWSSYIAGNIMNLIRLSEDQESCEKIPNIFFVSSLELFNQTVLNASSSNTNIDQITHSGLELVVSIDPTNNHLFKDIAIRKSIYMLALNTIIKCRCSSSHKLLTSNYPSQLESWLYKVETLETDPTNIQFIQEIKSNIS